MPYVTNKSILDNQSRDYVLLTCTVYKSLVCKMEYHSWRPHRAPCLTQLLKIWWAKFFFQIKCVILVQNIVFKLSK